MSLHRHRYLLLSFYCSHPTGYEVGSHRDSSIFKKMFLGDFCIASPWPVL